MANVANLSKRINLVNVSDDPNEEDTENANIGEFSDYFPQLIWVLRDFSLDTGDKSAKEYLEFALKEMDESELEGAVDKNLSRSIIKRNFKNRECHTLVVPSTDDQRIKRLENEEKSHLRPEFVKQVDDLIMQLRHNVPMKKINNVYLDGEALFGLVQSKFKFYENFLKEKRRI